MVVQNFGNEKMVNRCCTCDELLRTLRGIQIEIVTETTDWGSTDVVILDGLWRQLAETAELYSNHLAQHYTNPRDAAHVALGCAVRVA